MNKKPIIVFTILFTIVIFINSNQSDQGIITSTSGLVLRKEPTVKSNKILTIPYNSLVKIINKNGPEEIINGIKSNWYNVCYKNETGWVFGGYIESADPDYEYYNDKYAFHLTESDNLYQSNSMDSKIIDIIHSSDYYQVLQKSNQSFIKNNNNVYWHKIKLPDNTLGWIAINDFVSPLDYNEYNELQKKFNKLKIDLNNYKVPDNKGNIKVDILFETQWGPNNKRYGDYWEFYNNGTFTLWDNTGGAVPEVGVWKIINGYLVTILYGTAEYGKASELYDKKFYWDFKIDNNSLFSRQVLESNTNIKIYNNKDQIPDETIIQINGIKSSIFHKDAIINESLNIFEKPDLKSKIIEYQVFKDEKIKNFEKGKEILILAYTKINNNKWYYIDTKTDVWLNPRVSDTFGWVLSDYIKLK